MSFSNGIGNAPKKVSYKGSRSNNDVIAVNSASNSSMRPSVGVGSRDNSHTRPNAGGSQSIFNAQTSTTNAPAASGGGMGGGMIALGGGESGGNGGGSGGGYGGGGMFNSSSPSSNGSVMQKGPGDPWTPADPGGSEDDDEDLGAPLPVGDGLGVLLAMSLFYLLYLFRKRKLMTLK